MAFWTRTTRGTSASALIRFLITSMQPSHFQLQGTMGKKKYSSLKVRTVFVGMEPKWLQTVTDKSSDGIKIIKLKEAMGVPGT